MFLALAGLATFATGQSAMARPIRPNQQQTAFTLLLRSVRQQNRISLLTVRQSAISQLQQLNFQRNHGLISRSTFIQSRASLISNYRLAQGQMRALISAENFQLQTLLVQVRTGQISIDQFNTQATSVVSASHAQQLALIARVQAGLINPATPFG